MRIGMRHRFIGLLGGGVERQRMIGAIGLDERRHRIGAIDGACGRDQKMAHGMNARELHHIERSNEIGVDVCARIFEAIANASLRCEVNDDVGRARLHCACQRIHILEHGDGVAKAVAAEKDRATRLFQSQVVI